MDRRFLAVVTLLPALLLSGCREERLVETACREDSQCESGFLCEDFRCIPAETKACDVVIDGNPILQPTPYTVSFGDLDEMEATQTFQLHNLGNCTLTVYEASLKGGVESPFSTDLVGTGFPLEVFPGRSRTFTVNFKAQGVGSFADEIKILSDDKEFPELRVPMHANFLGVPELRIAPNPIDFGYVAQGRNGKRHVTISNQGTGVAELKIESIKLQPESDHFSFLGELPTEPVSLKPTTEDKNAVIQFDLQFHPRDTGTHLSELVVVTNKGETRVLVSGNAETPPKLTVAPMAIDLGQVPLGHTNVQPITLVNEGGAPLDVQYLWGGPTPSTDLFATPTLIPPIAPGAYTELQVAVTATAIGPYNGLLILTSNDPSRPSLTIAVTAEGVPGPGPEVVKVEMSYDNGADNVFDKDIRNVDMTLEHPYGYVCNKDNPAPTNWGNYGNATWIAFGPKEEPERIVLADAIQDGTYRVMLQYMEDCASLPTELMAGILGISVEALIAYLTGGISIPGQDIGDLIEQLCLDHKSSNATVRVYVNGAVIQEKTVNIGGKGDTIYAVDLVRSGGKFSAK